MPYNLLVTTCACAKQQLRYIPKEGAEIVMNASEKEHVIFFEIDEQTNEISQFRKHFAMMGSKEKICDLLIFYYAESKKPDIRRDPKIVCLAESKSTHVKEAIEQIENTFNHIKTGFADVSGYNTPIIWCAFISTIKISSGPSFRRKDYRDNLRIPGILYGTITTNEDIGDFLRSCWLKIQTDKKFKGKK